MVRLACTKFVRRVTPMVTMLLGGVNQDQGNNLRVMLTCYVEYNGTLKTTQYATQLSLH